MDKEVRHKFINNALRLEIINKLIMECLEDDKSIDPEYIVDLKKSLEDHLIYIKGLKPF